MPREEFGRFGERGIQKYCRPCRSEYMRGWRLKKLGRATPTGQVVSGFDKLAAKYANR